MDRLLSRELFVQRVAQGLDLVPEDLELLQSGGAHLDPVALHRLDEIVSTELGVELPEGVLAPSSDIDTIYRAYVVERVATDLRTPGTPA